MKKFILIILLFIPLTVWFILTFTAIVLEKFCELITTAANMIENKINI